jgi:hypothetical protein
MVFVYFEFEIVTESRCHLNFGIAHSIHNQLYRPDFELHLNDFYKRAGEISGSGKTFNKAYFQR